MKAMRPNREMSWVEETRRWLALELSETQNWRKYNSYLMVVQDEGHHVLRDNKWGKAMALFPYLETLIKGGYDTLLIIEATPGERANAVSTSIFLHTQHASGLRTHVEFLTSTVIPRFGKPLTANPVTIKRVYAKGMHFVYEPEGGGGTEYVLQHEAYSHGFGSRERLIGWYALAIGSTKAVRFTMRELNQCNIKP